MIRKYHLITLALLGMCLSLLASCASGGGRSAL
jgi:hypothetical protein